MNSAPPAMRSISSRRRSSSSSSIRVCVGSPGTFSTRKCLSATLAICGRCVIVSTCARSASRCSVAATACAVTPPMPASISSKTSVSPPATAASARAMRESSPPEAVSAIGANGRPGFGRMRNVTSSAPVAPASRSRSSTRNSPSPMPSEASSSATASRERFRVRLACGAQLGRDRVHARLGALHRALSPPRPDRRPQRHHPARARPPRRARAARRRRPLRSDA